MVGHLLQHGGALEAEVLQVVLELLGRALQVLLERQVLVLQREVGIAHLHQRLLERRRVRRVPLVALGEQLHLPLLAVVLVRQPVDQPIQHGRHLEANRARLALLRHLITRRALQCVHLGLQLLL